MLYLVAIATTFWVKWIALAIYVGVALLWLIPDRRIEHVVLRDGAPDATKP